MTRQLGFIALLAIASVANAQDPWADAVVEYIEGSDPGAGFTDASTALGEPTRFTVASFGSGPVTPFFAAAGTGDIVSIGEGGSLTVSFDEPVTNDPNNPFGIDLLVFGNAFLFGSEFPITPTTTAAGVFNEGGMISVSANGTDFFDATGVDADALYPTAGFLAFDDGPGDATSDFLLPVDPSYNPVGDTPAEIYAAYNGSGGGAGIDIGLLGLSEISYVRITNAIGSGVTPEIDGFADVRAVPEPSTLLLVLAGCGTLLGARR
ncbi:MAG: PEP-CTERM sorting domain-containing protein [Planctomycetota bacterium]